MQNLQYNSPMPLYSNETAQEQYRMHANQVPNLQNSAPPAQLGSGNRQFNASKSETLRAIQEEEDYNTHQHFLGDNFHDRVAMAEQPNVPPTQQPEWAHNSRPGGGRPQNQQAAGQTTFLSGPKQNSYSPAQNSPAHGGQIQSSYGTNQTQQSQPTNQHQNSYQQSPPSKQGQNQYGSNQSQQSKTTNQQQNAAYIGTGRAQNSQIGGQTQQPQSGGYAQNRQIGGPSQQPQGGGQPQSAGYAQNRQIGGSQQNFQYTGQQQLQHPNTGSQNTYSGGYAQESYPTGQGQQFYADQNTQQYSQNQFQTSYTGQQQQNQNSYAGGNQAQQSYEGGNQAQNTYADGNQAQNTYAGGNQAQNTYAGGQSQNSYSTHQSQNTYPTHQSQQSYAANQPQNQYSIGGGQPTAPQRARSQSPTGNQQQYKHYYGTNNSTSQYDGMIPSRSPPRFTTDPPADVQHIRYSSLPRRRRSTSPNNQVSAGASERGYLFGGMDFIDHSQDPNQFNVDEDYEYWYANSRKKDQHENEKPGHKFGVEYNESSDRRDFPYDENYRGYAPLHPRKHWHYAADPCAPVNSYVTDVLECVDPVRLIGDTIANHRVPADRPLTEEEKSILGTPFTPPPGFRPEHRTVRPEPKEPEPICYSLSVKKYLARRSQSAGPMSTGERLEMGPQYRDNQQQNLGGQYNNQDGYGGFGQQQQYQYQNQQQPVRRDASAPAPLGPNSNQQNRQFSNDQVQYQGEVGGNQPQYQGQVNVNQQAHYQAGAPRSDIQHGRWQSQTAQAPDGRVPGSQSGKLPDWSEHVQKRRNAWEHKSGQQTGYKVASQQRPQQVNMQQTAGGQNSWQNASEQQGYSAQQYAPQQQSRQSQQQYQHPQQGQQFSSSSSYQTQPSQQSNQNYPQQNTQSNQFYYEQEDQNSTSQQDSYIHQPNQNKPQHNQTHSLRQPNQQQNAQNIQQKTPQNTPQQQQQSQNYSSQQSGGQGQRPAPQTQEYYTRQVNQGGSSGPVNTRSMPQSQNQQQRNQATSDIAANRSSAQQRQQYQQHQQINQLVNSGGVPDFAGNQPVQPSQQQQQPTQLRIQGKPVQLPSQQQQQQQQSGQRQTQPPSNQRAQVDHFTYHYPPSEDQDQGDFQRPGYNSQQSGRQSQGVKSPPPPVPSKPQQQARSRHEQFAGAPTGNQNQQNRYFHKETTQIGDRQPQANKFQTNRPTDPNRFAEMREELAPGQAGNTYAYSHREYQAPNGQNVEYSYQYSTSTDLLNN